MELGPRSQQELKALQKSVVSVGLLQQTWLVRNLFLPKALADFTGEVLNTSGVDWLCVSLGQGEVDADWSVRKGLLGLGLTGADDRNWERGLG